jgi:hypothetical protein
MEFTKESLIDFYVHELAIDSAGAKITSGKTIELRIFHVVENGVYQLYDWDDGTFKDSAVVNDEDTCSHKQAGGAYNTGVWENNTAIDKDAFTAGHKYIFEFWNSTDGEFIATPSEIQWGGQYGDIATQTKLTIVDTVVDANKVIIDALPNAGALTDITNKTDNLPASPAAIGSEMALTTTTITAVTNAIEALTSYARIYGMAHGKFSYNATTKKLTVYKGDDATTELFVWDLSTGNIRLSEAP